MKKSLLALVAFSFVAVSFAQSPPAASSRPAEGGKKANSWPSVRILPAQPEFVSLDGRFKIGLPRNIQGFQALSPKQTRTQASGQKLTWEFAEAVVFGSFLDFPESTWSGSVEDVTQIAANSKKLVVNQLPNAKLLFEAVSAVSGIPSAYFIYDLGTDGFIAVYLFLDKKRLYRFNAVFKDRATEEALTSAFKTFRLIPQSEVYAELAKKYEAMRPDGLPQSPVVKKQTSDAKDEGLNGKVKRVVEESEDQSGTWSVQGRKTSSVEYYDQSGALTQRDSYDSQGNPFQITVYGYIDGKRVSTSKVSRYEYDPPPMMAISSGEAKTAPSKRDSRYEYSFEYKYENGKLIERQMVYNDGRRGMRYIYKHSPNKVEELVYTDEGKLNQSYLSVLDANGNEVERTDFRVVNPDIHGDRKYKYFYEFDKEGNWTKRTTSKAANENGVTNWQPYSVYYRMIYYY